MTEKFLESNESAHLAHIKQEYQECLTQRKIHNQWKYKEDLK